MSRDVAAFVREALSHEARDLSLFELALTHSSLPGGSYERLEFLGDRVLGMVIAHALYERYPDEPEGHMSKRYNAVVDRATCAENGREIGIPMIVRLGKQAREDGASQSDNVVGDVIESLIGALFIDGGLDAAREFILKVWGPDLARQSGAPQHPKSALQELAAARGTKAPLYEVTSRTGAHHAPRFTVRVSIPRVGEASADGASKQEAEKAAAAALLGLLT